MIPNKAMGFFFVFFFPDHDHESLNPSRGRWGTALFPMADALTKNCDICFILNTACSFLLLVVRFVSYPLFTYSITD